MAAPADRAWLSLAVAVSAYELAALARGWDLLSEACDRYRANRPVLTHLAVGYLALHLLRRWPSRADPLALFAARWRRDRTG